MTKSNKQMTKSKKKLKNAKKKVATEGKRNNAKKKNMKVATEGTTQMNKEGGNASVSFFLLYLASLIQGFKNHIVGWIGNKGLFIVVVVPLQALKINFLNRFLSFRVLSFRVLFQRKEIALLTVCGVCLWGPHLHVSNFYWS